MNIKDSYHPITVNLPAHHVECVGNGNVFYVMEMSLKRSVNGKQPKRLFYYEVLNKYNDCIARGYRSDYMKAISYVRNKAKSINT